MPISSLVVATFGTLLSGFIAWASHATNAVPIIAAIFSATCAICLEVHNKKDGK